MRKRPKVFDRDHDDMDQKCLLMKFYFALHSLTFLYNSGFGLRRRKYVDTLGNIFMPKNVIAISTMISLCS